MNPFDNRLTKQPSFCIVNSPERDLSERLAKLSPEQRAALRKRLAKSQSATAAGGSQTKSESGNAKLGANDPAEPIAIVGVSCRFPGAPDLDAYWRVISEGIDATAEIPPERWNVDSLYDPTGQKAGRMSVRRAGMVDGIDQFDPKFFGISPREAARMDPQQRMLLEVSWEAFEVAGIPVSQLAGTSVGAYVGIGGTDYSKVPSTYDGYYQYIDAHVGTGNALSIAANRLSYIMDLRGPSMAIDTACSSSTMAIHLAVQSLRSGECDAALAGGVNAILTPETTIAFSKARMLSPDGQCRPFDADANGYVRGEGCGMLVLKRLRDAERDRDHIWGTILASATNQDGRTSGITAPNGVSQQAVIRAALKEAGIPASRVNYIEAHGTGTPLGDPIEVDALTKVFSGQPGVDPPCYVTSVKANVGHMETVSGVAGIIKLLLMMRHQTIPGQLHLQKLNPRMSLKRSRIVIPSESPAWPVDGEPLVAGVSSFGFGGANTHLVLQQHLSSATVDAGEPKAPPPERTSHVMTLSGKSEQAISQVASRLQQHLESTEDDVLDVAHTMNVGRVHHPQRAAVVFSDEAQLLKQLTSLSEGKKGPGIRSGHTVTSRSTRTAFLFTGQGSQAPGMGRGLYETHGVFREAMNQCDEGLKDLLPKRLLDVLYGDEQDSDLVHQTNYTQPALFAIEYSLAQLWLSWGVKPHVVMGHSVGEFAAACVAGIVSLDDALRLIAHRGRLMGALPEGGGMTAMFESSEVIAEQLKKFRGDDEQTLSIAAENGPQNTAVSGSLTELQKFADHCERAGIASKSLQVSHAFHSQLMEPMLDEFRSIAEQCEFQKPRVPLVSNLTGKTLEGTWDADYLCNHIRKAVRFEPSMHALQEMDVDVMLEVGPSPILTGMGRRCLPDSKLTWATSLRTGNDDENTLYEALADVHCRGAKVDWKAFDQPWKRRRLVLPTYPFDRQRYWLDPSDEIVGDPSQSHASGDALHPLLGRLQPTALQSRLFENALSADSPEFLADHAVQGSVNLPGAAFVETAFAAARQRFGEGRHQVTDVSIEQAMFVSKESWKAFQTIVDESLSLEIFSRDRSAESGTWQRHMSATLVPAEVNDESEPVAAPDELATVGQRYVGGKDHGEFYDLMSQRRLEYGPRFRMLRRVDYSLDEAVGLIQCDEATQSEFAEYVLHPVLGDALMQTFSALVPRPNHNTFSEATYMPTKVGLATVYQAPAGTLRTYGKRTSAGDVLDPEFVEGDVWLVNDRDEVVAEWTGVRVTRVGRAGGEATESLDDALYQLSWEASKGFPAESDGDLGGKQVWVLGDDAARREAVVSSLRAQGATVVAGDLQSDWKTLAGEQSDAGPLAAIVSLWAAGDSAEVSDVANQSEMLCQLALQQLRSAIVDVPVSSDFRGWWHVTEGAQSSVSGNARNMETTQLTQSSLWGMVRVGMMELADLKPALVDWDPQQSAAQNASLVASELVNADGEDHVLFRGGERLVGRLAKRQLPQSTDGDTAITIPAQPHRLRFRQTGSFDSLYFEPMEREEPIGNEVEIRIAAAGLNFSDVLKVMGLYPGITDKVVPLGIECSGTVTAVGPDAKRFEVGDSVMGVAPFAFGSHAKTPEYTLVKRPAGMDDVDAATIPIAFLTAWYGLVHLADVQPGERVLIHAGAGGVGLAATQIAQLLGAEVIATAGSDEKREFLRGCGVKHVFNSRTTQFADDIRRTFGGEGVDVVLNSLPGDAIPKSLGVLNAYGRFLEIGKTDIYQDRKVGLLPFQDNLSYHAIDLDRVLRQRPKKIEKLWNELSERFDSGKLQPIACTEFEQTEMVETFRYMAQRKNIGKVITRMATGVNLDSGESESSTQTELGSVLITGGTGAIGLKLAQRLVEDGHRSLALLSRREPSAEVASAIDSIRASADNVNIEVVQGDVGQLESLQAALTTLPATMPPIRHVYHAAGVLRDGLLMDMTDEQLRVPFQPKVQGGWNLHEATKDLPLESFVMFSSIAACLGSPGQANYAAANSFLDGLADYRRGLGLPATSIAWGPWADSGMAATEDRSSQLQSRGMRLLPADACFETMQELVDAGDRYVAVMDVDWPAMIQSMRRTRPFFAEFADQATADSERSTDQVDHEFRGQIAGLDQDDRSERLREYFATELARLMGWEAEQIDVKQKLSELGMDSLIAMELKNNLEQRLAITIPMSALVESPSINSLVSHVVSQFGDGDGSKATDKTTAKGSGKQEASALIVPLKSDGNRSPWLCVHPLGGSSACYLDFSQQVDEDQPVYALVGGGSDGVSEPPTSLDSMMREYVGLVEQHFADDELRLIGWSAGGVFALELARRLEEAGRENISVSLLDTPLPSIYRNVDPNDDVQFVADLIQFSNAFSGTDMHLTSDELEDVRGTDRIWQRVLEEAQRAGVLSQSASPEMVRKLIDTSRQHVKFIKGYQINPKSPSVQLILPESTTALESSSGENWTDHLDWSARLSSEVRSEQTSGDHFSMLTGEHARELAKRMEQHAAAH